MAKLRSVALLLVLTAVTGVIVAATVAVAGIALAAAIAHAVSG